MFRPVPDGDEPWLNLSGAARHVGVTAKTLRLAAKAGDIEATHPLPDGPWIFSRAELTGPGARQIADRARLNPNTPRDRTQINKAYSLQQRR